MDYESRNGIQTNKKANSRVAHVNCTYRKGRTYFLPCGSRKGNKRGFGDGKRREADANLLRQSRLARSRSKLHANGKIDSGFGKPSKRLKRYFQAHPIIFITNQPIKQILSKPEVAGRLHKWSIELGEYDIHYRPRISAKGQILADFIVERPEDDSPATPMEVEEKLLDPWTLFTDGSSYLDGSGAELILTNIEGIEFTYALIFRFDATNNEAEYEALIAGLRIAEQMELKEKSINEVEVLAVIEKEGSTWMTPIYEYLTQETL
nr:reverse transcriptase domain-containing protein [Tanacetum cinerariifolium]